MSGGGLDLVLRGRRVVTPGGERACSVGVAGGRIVAVEPLPVGPDGRPDGRPGAVRAPVRTRPRWSSSVTTWSCCPAWSTPTCTSTSRAARSGRASPARPARPPPVASPRSSTCRSTASRRPRRSRRSAGQAGRRGRSVLRRRGLLGRGGPRQPGRPARAARRGGLRRQGLPAALRRRGVPAADPVELEAVLREVAALGALMVVHAEDAASIGHAVAPQGRSYRAFLASRPRGAENLAVAQVIEAARRTGARVHVLHLSSADALPMVASARRDGVRLSVETCPHYLTFDAEDVPDGATLLKCCPPIREADNRDLLWAGAGRGRHRHRGVRPLAVHPGAQAPRQRRLRAGVGRDRLAAARSAGGVDAGPRARPRAARRGPLDGRAPRPAGRAHPQGPDRGRRRRRPVPVRPRRDVRGRPRPAAPPAPGQRLRGTHPARRRTRGRGWPGARSTSTASRAGGS